MRLFVAVDVPQVFVPGFSKGGSEEQSHLTLRFLGEVSGARVGEIGHALEDALAGAHGGSLTLQGLGVFPDRGSPRVLWVGVSVGEEMLIELHGRVERAMASIGFPPDDHPFHPHLTISRPKGRVEQEAALKAASENRGKVFATCRVAEVVLKESILRSSGAEHRPLLALPLSVERS